MAAAAPAPNAPHARAEAVETSAWGVPAWSAYALARFWTFEHGGDMEDVERVAIPWAEARSLLDSELSHLRLLGARGLAVAGIDGEAGVDSEETILKLFELWKQPAKPDAVAASCAAAFAAIVTRKDVPAPVALPGFSDQFASRELRSMAPAVPERYRRAAALAAAWRFGTWSDSSIAHIAAVGGHGNPWLMLIPILRR